MLAVREVKWGEPKKFAISEAPSRIQVDKIASRSKGRGSPSGGSGSSGSGLLLGSSGKKASRARARAALAAARDPCCVSRSVEQQPLQVRMDNYKACINQQ